MRCRSQTSGVGADHTIGRNSKACCGIFHPSGLIINSKMRSGGSLSLARGTGRVDTAFIYEKADEVVHGRVVGTADQRGRLTFLRHQAGQDQPMQVMRERRGRDPEFLLQAADRQPAVAGPDESPINLKPRRVSERFKLLCCLFDIHGNKLQLAGSAVNGYFRNHRNSGEDQIATDFTRSDSFSAPSVLVQTWPSEHKDSSRSSCTFGWLTAAPPDSGRSCGSKMRFRTEVLEQAPGLQSQKSAVGAFA